MPGEVAVLLFTLLTGGVIITWITLHYRSLDRTKPKDLAAIEERLAKIEQAIDAIAVEAERISEGQRFTTKLLGEKADVRSGS